MSDRGLFLLVEKKKKKKKKQVSYYRVLKMRT